MEATGAAAAAEWGLTLYLFGLSARAISILGSALRQVFLDP